MSMLINAHIACASLDNDWIKDRNNALIYQEYFRMYNMHT
jgi:hypothetical protein